MIAGFVPGDLVRVNTYFLHNRREGYVLRELTFSYQNVNKYEVWLVLARLPGAPNRYLGDCDPMLFVLYKNMFCWIRMGNVMKPEVDREVS